MTFRAGKERPMELDLPLIWAGVIGLAVAMYVILDGFDLGVGILFPFTAQARSSVKQKRGTLSY